MGAELQPLEPTLAQRPLHFGHSVDGFSHHTQNFVEHFDRTARRARLPRVLWNLPLRARFSHLGPGNFLALPAVLRALAATARQDRHLLGRGFGFRTDDRRGAALQVLRSRASGRDRARLVDLARARLSPRRMAARGCGKNCHRQFHRPRHLQSLVLARPAASTPAAGLCSQGKRRQVRHRRRQLSDQSSLGRIERVAQRDFVPAQRRTARAGRHRAVCHDMAAPPGSDQ